MHNNYNPRLRESHHEMTIPRMPIGRVMYTVSWAVIFDLDGDAYLNPAFLVSDNAAGTVKMPVCRNEDGFHILLTDDHHVREELDEDVQYIPVRSVNHQPLFKETPPAIPPSYWLALGTFGWFYVQPELVGKFLLSNYKLKCELADGTIIESV